MCAKALPPTKPLQSPRQGCRKNNFTPGEWKGLRKSAVLAGYAVAGAAPSKQWDFVREMAVVFQDVIEGERSVQEDSLHRAVIAGITPTSRTSNAEMNHR